MQTKLSQFVLFLLLLGTSSCNHLLHYFDEVEPRPLVVKEFAKGLHAPIGLVVDAKGQLWVAEAGSGKDDSQISLIAPEGKVYKAIEGFRSIIFQGEPAGLTHLALKDGTLWILQSAEGKLYRADVVNFQPGDTPLKASDLPSEDISTFVRENNVELSNLFNLTFGSNGELYIVDAAANAIIKRDQSGDLSIFAKVKGINNPSQVGPPVIDAVPTGIVFDGQKLLVTTFMGFPFPANQALIYQYDLQGNYTIYQEGFNSLIDIELGPDHRPVVLEFGKWNGQGFAPSSGSIVRATGEKQIILTTGLNQPTDIVKCGLKSYYVSSIADGKVWLVTYP